MSKTSNYNRVLKVLQLKYRRRDMAVCISQSQEGKKEEDQDHILRKYPVSSFPERKIEGKKREREKYF